jgi:amino acid adenylation domain-containing protein
MAAGLPEVHSPTSITQHGLWLLDRLQSGSPAFHVPLCLRIAGRLDRAELAAAVNGILRRHEALRTRFPWFEDGPVQLVEPFVPRPLKQVDLEALPPEVRHAEADRLVAAELRRPFSLDQEPPLRRLLARCGSDEHVLLLTAHHLVVDGGSLNVLTEELGILYRSFAAGEAPRLAEPRLRYSEYARWQRSRLAGEFLDRLVTYWKKRLEPPIPVLDLPADRPRTAPRGTRGGMVRRPLPAPLIERLRGLAASRGATFFLVLLSAFEVLLARWSGQEDFVVGIPVLHRDHPDREHLVGLLVEMLPLRADLRGDPSFLDLLSRTRETFLADVAHQDLPLATLVETIRPPADLARPLLLQAMLALDPPLARPDFPGLYATWQFPETGAAKLELSLELLEDEGWLEGFWEYNRDLFDGTTIERMATHLETLCGGILRAAEGRLSYLSLMTAAEASQLQAWNQTHADRPRDLCAHEMFEAQADRAPGREAARCAGEVATYGALEERANRLARYLRSRGLAMEGRVGICLDRSLDMVVAVLAVLKAGGAYVPLDPAYPRERLAFMVRDAGLKALVTQESLAGVYGDFPGATVKVDADRERIAALPSSRPARGTHPEALAYVIYTSGSTGQPKGVGVPHGALVNFLQSMRRAPGLSPAATVLALTTLSFDISGLEILLPLVTGARVVVAPARAGGDVESLLPLLAEATMVQATPVTWRLLADADWRAAGRRILCGGEALPRELADRLLAGGAELWNLYGPTEATIWTSVDRVVPGDGPVLLGGPIANTEMHVVDGGLHLVPAGVAGELLIGGDGLARSYVGRPGLTAERFVPNPFGEPGSRLYRTGDLARRRGDRIEFLGRIDHQIKLRGFRIEPGEIEAVLVCHPAVAAAVVMPRQDGDGDRRLVAYVVPAQGSFASGIASELRAFLGSRLPEHMLPAAFVPLAALPLTASGKVDRGALPAPEQERPSIRTEYLAPRNAVEQSLSEMWSKVLGIDSIGIDDDFFELGGQSLQVIQVVFRIRSRLGRDLPLSSLQRASTIRALAELLGQGAAPSHFNPLVCLQPAGERRPFFCIHGAGGQVLRYIPLARALGTGRPFWALQAPGLGPGEKPFTTVEEMAACYLDAIREVQRTGPYLLGGYSLGGLIAYEMARRLEAEGERVAFLGLIDMGAEEGAAMDSWDDLQVLVFWTRLFGLEVSAEQLAVIPPERRLERLLEIAKSMQRLPSEFTVADARRYLRVHQQTLWATRAYVPGTYGGRLILFKGDEGPDSGDTLGWQRVAAGTEILRVSGSHDQILSMPHLEHLAARLRETLDRADP